MADSKISQLTETSTINSSDVLPVINAGETKKVTLTNLNDSLPITTFVQTTSAGWGDSFSYMEVNYEPPYTGGSNLTNVTDNYIPWKTSTTNNTSRFELLNVNTGDARVQIKTTGLYDFIFQAVYFDLWNNLRFTANLDVNFAATGGSWTRVTTLFQHMFTSGTVNPPGQVVHGRALVDITNANRYYSVSLNPSINSPFPAGLSGGTTFTKLLIRKVG